MNDADGFLGVPSLQRPTEHWTTTSRPIPSTFMKSSSEVISDNLTFKTKLNDVFNGLPFNIFMCVITFYVLFADDFRMVFFPPSADMGFTIVVLICMLIYVLELVLTIIAKPEYLCSFFFWLDLLAICTMIFDLMWINVGGAVGIATNIMQAVRAGKASRIGVRSARMLRIAKLMQNIQEYKTVKQQISSEQSKPMQGMIDNSKKTVDLSTRRRGMATVDPIDVSSLQPPQPIFPELIRVPQKKSSQEIKILTYSQLVDPKETRVGIKLKEAMETNTTMMIMLVLISVPLLSSTTWFQERPTEKDSINQLNYFLQKSSDQITIHTELQIFVAQSLQNIYPLIYLQFPANTTCCVFPRDFPNLSEGVPSLQSIRPSSTIRTNIEKLLVVYDTTANDIFTSELNIGRTMFVVILLIFSSLFFSQDIEIYVLEPLDSMLNTVKRISSDPLKAVIALENQNLIKSTLENLKEKKVMTEVSILENMMMKIGSLLVVGFGEAGSEIIVKNIETHGDINPVLSGAKSIALFGFCDIRNFTDATEVLQTQVMDFVNDVAAIVHGVVHKCGGSANKNIGDAFLLVWKFKHKEVFLSENNGRTEVTLRKIKKVFQIADLAVFSFVKIIAELSKSPKMLKYANNQALKDRIKNFTGVKMGFGMHVGWAIEGAIGSRFKIDASYLSPNVNMASRLEAATKQFGVSTLFSGQLVQLMTPNNRRLMRKIDCVTVKGSIEPIELFTLDLYTQGLETLTPVSDNSYNIPTPYELKKVKMFAHKTREAILNSIESGKNITDRMFVCDKDFEKMREPFSQDFFKEWSEGLDLYTKGEWIGARNIFERTQKIGQDLLDGPSCTLLEVIESYKGVAPEGWQGFRQLTQK